MKNLNPKLLAVARFTQSYLFVICGYWASTLWLKQNELRRALNNSAIFRGTFITEMPNGDGYHFTFSLCL
jgi:hypothetical protein